MNKNAILLIFLVILAGMLVGTRADDGSDQSEFPQITEQPIDQDVAEGQATVLSVQATNVDGFQWMRDGVPIEGETNSTLALENIGTNHVGYYSCSVYKGSEAVPTRSASVIVSAATAGAITVYGTPVTSGGSSGSCPGAYAGYVFYKKTIAQGWGWAPSATTPHTASDGGGRTDTKVEYLGKLTDSGCNQTSVTVPHPTVSAKYRFTIYFPNNVPTGPYPLVLNGFNP